MELLPIPQEIENKVQRRIVERKTKFGERMERSPDLFVKNEQKEFQELREKDIIISEQKKRIEQMEDELEQHRNKIMDLQHEIDRNRSSDMETNEGLHGGKNPQSRYWTVEEHQRFLEAIRKFGEKDVKAIASYVGSRNPTQVRTHGQKYYLRLEREKRKKDEETRTIEVKADEMEKNKSNSKKKSQNLKRRKSLGDSPQLIQKEGQRTQNPVIPHFIQQQIAAETKDSVLAALTEWSSEEYSAFIEGLVTYSEEKDINVRCRLIADNYLPHLSADEIKECFSVLSTVAKAKERDEPHDDYNVEGRKSDIFSHLQPPTKVSTEISDVSSFRFAGLGPIRYPYHTTTAYAHDAFPTVYHPSHSTYPQIERRASFPMDTAFVKSKHPEAADSFDASPLWQHSSNGVEMVEFNHLDHTQL